MQSYEKQIWHCRFLSEFVRICQFLSVFGTMLFLAAKLRKRKLALSVYVSLCQSMSLYVTFRSIASFTLQSYEKDFCHCHLLSLFVTFCHLLSPFSKLLFHDAKLRNGICHCPHLSAYVRICPEMSAFVRSSFSLQSYEKENWHCPALSSYVHLCPFMSSYGIASSRNLRCKVTKSKFGTVQICPIMSIYEV